MTKKEIYYMSLEVSRSALKAYFDINDNNSTSFGDKYFQSDKGKGKAIAKKVYDVLAQSLLDDDEQ